MIGLEQKAAERKKVLCSICHCLTPIELIVENRFINPDQIDEQEYDPRHQRCEMCEENEPAIRYCNECGDWLCSRLSTRNDVIVSF